MFCHFPFALQTKYELIEKQLEIIRCLSKDADLLSEKLAHCRSSPP